MNLTERRYHAYRGNDPDSYQTLDVVQEEPVGHSKRRYIKFTLLEQRWRSKKEAAEYLRWAASEIEKLPEG